MRVMTQIFLCYARQDEGKVENLYRKLSDAGFKPWMDKKDILPGEDWKSTTQRAIRHSDFFLTCLSANSIKRGFLQKEIKDALDIWQEMFDSDIYLIPVRLEDCEVPESLRDFQWVNLFEEDGWTRLVKAIQAGMERRREVGADLTTLEDTSPVGPRGEHVRGVRFVNREYELLRMCTLNGAQFILIDAPAGYGKSHLLFEVRKQLCGLSGKPLQKPRNDYPCIRCALVEFSDRLTSERQVLDSICQQMDISIDSVGSARDLASNLITIAERPKGQTGRLATVLLLFDNVDQIRIESVKPWLVGKLIAGIDRGFEAVKSGIKLRVVLAGRFVAHEWDALGKKHGLKFALLPLSPFSRDIVEEALRLKAKEVGQNLEPSACSGMARGIVQVTGGHPRCMSLVIDSLAEKNFVVNYEGFGNYFDDTSEEIFKECVKPTLEELMGKLDEKLSDLLWRLSVLRRFDQRIVEILFNSEEIEGFHSDEETFASLAPTTLITPPDSFETFHTDRIVRRLLILAMKADDPKLFNRLNLIALYIFSAWLDGKNIEAVSRVGAIAYTGELPSKPKDQLQVVLVREYLYHYLQSVKTLDENALEQEAKRLHAKLDSSLGAHDIPNQHRRLRKALEADWELEDRIYYLAGGEKAGKVLWKELLEWACGPVL